MAIILVVALLTHTRSVIVKEIGLSPLRRVTGGALQWALALARLAKGIALGAHPSAVVLLSVLAAALR